MWTPIGSRFSIEQTMTTLSRAVAHHLELELVPAAHRLLDEHLADRALAQAALDLARAARAALGEAAAVAAERERRPDDRGHRDAGELVERR